MIWNRRTFLQGMLTAAATALVIDKLPSSISSLYHLPVAPAFNPNEKFYIYDLIAAADSPTPTPLTINLTRYGNSVLHAKIDSRSIYRWVAMQGCEINGKDLVNESSADLNITLMVKQYDTQFHRFIDYDGSVTPIEIEDIEHCILSSNQREAEWHTQDGQE